MKYLSFARLFGPSWRQTSRSAGRLGRPGGLPPRFTPRVERLEIRELLNNDAPFIKSITPADGSTDNLTNRPDLQIVFSEKMVVGGANGVGIDNKANYELFDSSGNPVSIDSVSVVDAPNNTTVDLAYNGGGALVAGTYQLFVRGDRLLDVDDGVGVSAPPRLYTANAGDNSVAVTTITGDGTLGAESNYPVPPGLATGRPAAPAALVAGDFNNDGIPDLAIVNAGTSQMAIYLGHKAADGGGFDLTPNLLLDISAASVNDRIVAGDFNHDGLTDLAVSHFNAGTVTVFLNQSPQPGFLQFGTGVDYQAGPNPESLIAADLEGTGFLDLAVADHALDASNNYSVIVLSNDTHGGFTSLHYTVGDNTPSGVQLPTSLAAGQFNNDNKLDLIVGGQNGLRALFNSTAPGFPLNFTAGPVIASVGTVKYLAAANLEHGGGTQDVVASEDVFTEQFLQNDGTGNFIVSTFATATQGGGPALAHDFTGDGLSDLVVASQHDFPAFVDSFHNTTVGGHITDATNAGPIKVTSPGHGLKTGQVIGIVGVQGNTAADGAFSVTVLDADHFTLDGSAGNGAYAGGGLWGLGGAVTGATNPASGPIVITSANHGLKAGDRIFVTGVQGNTAANGSWTVTVIDANRFSLNGSTGNAAYTGGGYFLKTASFAPFAGPAPADYLVGSGPMGLALLDANQDGNLDLVVTNFQDNSFSLLPGNGDGTFRVSAVQPAPTQPATAVAVGDLNGDGLPDMVVVNNNAAAGQSFVTVYPGKLDGTFGTPVAFAPAPAGSSMKTLNSVTIANVSGGKFPDIIFTDQTDATLGILANNLTTPGAAITASSFTAHAAVAVGAMPVQVVAGAFTHDGRLDLAVAHNQAGAPNTRRGVTVLLNQGNLTFTSSEVDSGAPAGGVAVADFNQDGNADLVVTENTAPGAVGLLTGDGKGNFTLRGTFATGVVNPGPVAVADFNGDGVPDVVVASTSGSATTGGIAVLLNQLGGSFGAAQTMAVSPGIPLNGLVVSDVNLDGHPDAIATVSPATPTTAATSQDNAFLLLGKGGGQFGSVIPYALGVGPENEGPTAVALGGAALVHASTFTVGGNLIKINLTDNGDFETPDLSGTVSNLAGWQTFNLPDNPGGSHGAWALQSGATSPLSGAAVPPPPSGKHQAMLDEPDLVPFLGGTNLNPPESYSGSHALYQTITLPANALQINLSLDLYIDSRLVPYTDAGSNPFLDYRTLAANQQVRVDILDPTVPGFDVLGVTAAAGVLKNEFRTSPTTPQVEQLALTDDLTAFAGKTIVLRIGETNNKGKLLVGVDNVQVVAKFADASPPALTGVRLRNPGFLGAPDGQTAHTTDPTVVGQVTTPFGPGSIAYIEFDPQGHGFGAPGNPRLTQLDAQGNFTFTPTGLQPGMVIVGVEVVDKAGNKATATLRFYYQPLSTDEFQAGGVGPVNTSGDTHVNYANVAGRVTATVVDVSDPTGNTLLVGTPGGGIWRTTDGGADWTPVSNGITDGKGNPIVPAVGALAQSRSSPSVLYAGLGVADLEPDSLPGSGVLKSVDGGLTWTLIGNSATVFANARISSLIIDANTPNRVYAAVAAGGNAGPGVYASTDGGLTWKNVLLPQNMFLPGGSRTNHLPAGTALASVTDLIIDPFNSNRLLVGLGNIGLVGASSTAGVWRTTDFGATWDEIVGGDNSSTLLPSGTGVGRVAIALGTGRVGEEAFVYVLVGNPPPAAGTTPPAFNLGDFQGLYRSTDALLNFTKVMLRQNTGSTTLPKFTDINLLGVEASAFATLVVDPTDPYVVFVGGSSRYVGGHALVRIDTGNMIPGTGDDSTKASVAAQMPFSGFYDPPPPNPGNTDPYKGEGVYWYDLIQGASGVQGSNNFVPDAITSLSFDAAGRLLVGTVGGVYRGTSLGFGYDFSSGGTGIVALANLQTFSAPGMSFMSLNGNLPSGELTSVAIDPLHPGTLYSTQYNTGGATLQAGSTSWVEHSLHGPQVGTGPLNSPTAGRVIAATPSPTAVPDAPATLLRVWQFASPLAFFPEISVDGGVTWQGLPTAGINLTGQAAGFFPAFAVNPNPVFDSGLFQTEIMLGGTRVFLTRTTSNSWDPVSPVLSTKGGLISALSFTSQSGFNYAGTNLGEIFVTTNAGGDLWPERDAGLPRAPVTSITVSANDPKTAFVTFANSGGGSVWMTSNAGVSWKNISANLPALPARGFAIDGSPNLGAPGGKLYVALDDGVFFSTNAGKSWQPLGSGLPNVAPTDLQFNQQKQELAVATLGRGAFTLSTAPISPIADVTGPEDLPLHPIAFSINENGIADGKITVSASSSNPTLIPSQNIQITGTGPDRTLNITPNPFLFGTSTITVSVSDGVNTFTRSFVVNIPFTNHLPTVSPIANQLVPPGTTVGPLAFTVGDAPTETPAAQLVVAARSSNQAVVPDANIVLGGSGANRTITVTPASATTLGTAMITLTVTDTDGGVTTMTFPVEFTAPVGLPFSDNFDRPDNTLLGPGWDQDVGDLANASNTAKSATEFAVATLDGVNQGNVVVQADVKVGTIGTQYAGLVVRYSGPGDTNMYWALIVGVNGTFSADILRNVNGAWAVLASVPVTSGIGTLRFEVAGPSLKLFDNGKLVTWANDTALTSGSVGMRASQGVPEDNFSASVPTLNTVTLPFGDNFNRADGELGPNWLDRLGETQVKSNQAVTTVLNPTSTDPNQTLALTTLNGLSAADVAVQADITLANTGVVYSGLVARYSGPGDQNMYWAGLIGVNGSFQAVIYRNVNGTWTQLNALTPVTLTGATNTLHFEVVGPSLKLFVNNTLTAFANDTVLTAPGTVGLRSGNGVTIDNFTTSALTLTSNSLPFGDTFARADGELGPNWLDRLGETQVKSNLAVTRVIDPNSSDANKTLALSTVNGVNAADVKVQADITLASTGVVYSGLVARYSGPGDQNMYWGGLIGVNGSFQAVIYRNLAGTWTQLNAFTPVTLGTPTNTLRFEVVGPSLKLFVNNTLAAFANDTVLTAPGTVGLRSGNGVTIANFSAAVLTLNPNSLPFGDNFNRADGELGPNWMDSLGEHQVKGNQVVSTVVDPTNTANPSRSQALATVSGISAADVTVQADVTVGATGTQFAGLVARDSGPGDTNMYWGVLVFTNGAYQADIFRDLNGTWSLLNSRPAGPTSPTNTLRFDVVGPSLKLFLNGSLAVFANDTALTAPGMVGVRNSNNGVFDNFSTKALTLNTVTLPFGDNFTRADGELGPNWLDRLGETQVKSNQAVTSVIDPNSSDPNKTLALSTLNGLSAADVTVQADVTIKTTGISYAGVVARYSGVGDQNMYWGGVVGVNGSYTAVLYVNVNGTWTQLAATAVGSNTGTLKLKVQGTALTLTYGAATLTATDGHLTSGTVGLRGGAGVTYGNFSAS